ncbi:Outer membrane protein transport protein (OMPP1/FadL/TodX) [Salinimicrobium catena]|uniref:Outer membrane protein transport protein (OMPP1/FadL/TodX) n=1 Tax=Salinimicrobium catena TaxID=390640 RepID=A0A1H5NI69_9FLAO|nr:outer membrane protein transport protein [Salinimicrobium catena]SDL45373.1 Outer membrane protein transport protein (OMPP1/FadL/TodX) [Salinimicrobium catena]SEF00418.1 Outer membrane protein transport protein (OMPP1/FadL/TodX) [Salinimicrobium catena]
MKKILFAFIAIASMTMEAQTISDAVRYSGDDLYGTARYRAMSGAFGALGGDLSSINVNPAGSAVFLNSIVSLSLDIENADNEVTYMDGATGNSNSDFDLGQGGIAMVFNNTDESSDWKKFTIAFNYSKTANFEDDFLAAGTNSSSIDQYFLGYAQGIPLDLLVPLEDESPSDLYSYLGEREGFGAQQAFLGYQSFILRAVDEEDFDNTEYYSTVAPGTFDQEYSYAATGLNGKFSFNFATQYQEFLYMGINLNTHFINYDRVVGFYENNNNAGSEINSIYFEDRLSTLGSGFSLQIGALTKLGENVRAGFSYESPTWYEISEETTQYLETNSNEFGRAVVDPNVINVYPDYKLQTPANYTGSLAYLFGGRALLSFDYSYKDYSSMKFKPKSDPDFALQNELLETELKGASTYRLGGEYRLEGWSLRGGYRFEESPFEDETTIDDLQGYSLGLGYNFGNIKLDVAYETFEQDRNPRLFETGLTDRAHINRKNNNVVLTLSFGI